MPVSDILGDNPHNKPNLGETGHKRPKSKAPTGIAWADYTLNPWIGCEKVSPACAHCYAETWDLRFNKGENWGRGGSRQLRVDRALGELRKIAAVGKHDGVIPRVFIASLSDVFEDRADLVEPRKKLWEGLHKIDGVIPMLLTKRPEVMAQWAAEHGWPAHAWAGVTVENQAMADRRVPELLRVPASVRFLSMEPLLEWVRLKVEWLDPWAFYPAGFAHTAARHDYPIPPSIGWVIAGGESGAHARPSHPGWFRFLREVCAGFHVPFFFKQWGEFCIANADTIAKKATLQAVELEPGGASLLMARLGVKNTGALLDGVAHTEIPIIVGGKHAP